MTEPAGTSRNSIVTWAALVALLVASAAAHLGHLAEPFTRNHESTASGPMVCAARNLLRYGFLECRFNSIVNTDFAEPDNRVWYAHHPPLVVVMQAASASVFGPYEWAWRLPSWICWVGATGMVFLLLNRRHGWVAGTAGGIIFTFSPFAWLFSDMPDVVGPHLVFFGLVTVDAYLRFMQTGSRRTLTLCCVAWFLCAMCDWPAYMLLPAILAHYVIVSPWRRWWRVVPLMSLTPLVMAGTIYWLIASSGDRSVLGQFGHRMSGQPDQGGTNITLADWWRVGITIYSVALQTLPVLLMVAASLLWTCCLIGARRWQSIRQQEAMLICFAWGLLHVVIGLQSSFQHQWVWVVLCPGIAMAAALLIDTIWQLVKSWNPWRPLWPIVGSALALVFTFSSYLSAHRMSEEGFGYREIANYDLRSFGLTINQETAPGEGVITSDMVDLNTGKSAPALWYYADRQLRPGVRTVEQLNQSLAAGPYLLFYDFIQAKGPAPTWFIMPAEHYHRFWDLSQELDRRYPRWDKRGVLIWYLPPSNAAWAKPAAIYRQASAE